eukprot:TRINITY_DN3416_c0_g1_i2.p1 TRINITY_DN3416_c0_g1~~TRINITY_DN3416_c0_g1_i2.p1  ORF type:complete len:212 (+),score=23.19 TRINITY_DN3416_c0_g1_i2:28-636(+)
MCIRDRYMGIVNEMNHLNEIILCIGAALFGIGFYLSKSKPKGDQPISETSNEKSNSSTTQQIEQAASFKDLKIRYMIPFFLLSAGYWLEGPYLRAIYQKHGFNTEDISLFHSLSYIGTSLASIFLGRIADQYGRKTLCSINGFIFFMGSFLRIIPSKTGMIIACFLKASSDVIIDSSYDAWFISEFARRKLSNSFSKSFYEE